MSNPEEPFSEDSTKLHETGIEDRNDMPAGFTGTDEITSRSLLGMSLASALFYLLAAAGAFYLFHEQGLEGAFSHGFSLSAQLMVGSASGLAAACVIIFFANRSPVADVLDDFAVVRTVRQMTFSPFDRIQLSLFAGAGEELLFRGALQPLLGIWVTSLIFVGIHGYFKFRSAGHWLFGALMFGLSLLLGFLFEYAGLISAMVAHALYDMLLLWWVRGDRE
ncbi:MAG: CPBP family intramembrane glutamic endopeptidase [Balneolaceae bacterium]